jgi:CheY-specific phosphatase CheX
MSSVVEVLEKMFFVSAGEGAGACAGSPTQEIAARVPFAGEPPGELTLQVTCAAARSIAADFLALEACELREDQITAVVCELANMICGSVLSRIESTAAFRLGTPRLFTGPEATPDIRGNSATHRVEMYDGALTVAMIMDVPACIKTAQ